MNSLFRKIIHSSARMDDNGIMIFNENFENEIQTSKESWEKIYDYDLNYLIKDRDDFDKNKLADHFRYISKYFNFCEDTVYLEIGCGPAYIGDYIMNTFDSYFIGVDFNYDMLLTLKNYFKKKGYKKFLLAYGDINNMMIKDNTIDFIYGGGVIEHFSNTNHIVKELYRILKPNGISFNTVPAFNLWWPLRFYNNIPSHQFLKKIFETIHIKILKNRVLENYFGYELSFTKRKLILLHEENGFKDIHVEPFAFHPSTSKLKNNTLRNLFYKTQSNRLTAAVYAACGKKSETL